MIPIINGHTLGIDAEWCQLMNQLSVSDLFVNLCLNNNKSIFHLTKAEV
jgi:hypothetical protein